MFLRKIRKNIKFNNKGNTMFETLVAFVVLAIILAIVYQMIAFCSELRMKATDTDTALTQFNQNMYKTNIPEDVIEVDIKKNKDGFEGPQFYLRVSEKTDVSNMKDVSTYATGDAYRLRMNHLNAKSLIPSEAIRNRLEEEKVVTPKALQFYYNK